MADAKETRVISKDFKKIYKSYKGDEKFKLDGAETSYTMLNFWQWSLSCIYESTTRGGFAEYIVKIALDEAGINANPVGRTGMDPYDLDGPKLKRDEPARIEVKCTSRYHVNQALGLVETKTHQFGIGKKRALDNNGDYPDDAPKKRNNDIYVFVMFNGDGMNDSFFDLSLWDFYVMPTAEIDNDPVYRDRTNIRLSVVQERCRKLSFDQLAAEIVKVCDQLRNESD